MKIVIKNIEDEANEFLVYLKTDDDVNVSAQFACKDTVQYIVEELIEESGEEAENVKIIHPDSPKENTEKDLPLILTFYLDRGLMENRQIINPFAEAVNEMIAEKGANVMAFFLPTDREERIECINPVLATPKERVRIAKLIDEIGKSFDIAQGADEN
jgi:hypothetical protein